MPPRAKTAAVALLVAACTDPRGATGPRDGPSAAARAVLSNASAPSARVVAVRGNDAGAGTVQDPLATLEEAFRRSAPGDTVLVRGGVYYRRRDLWVAPDAGGAPGRPTVLRAWPNEHPALDLSREDPGESAACVVVGGGWVAVIGFECRNSRNVGFMVYGGHDVQLRDNSVHHTQGTGIALFPDADGRRPRQVTIAHNVVRYTNLANRSPRTAEGGWGQGITALGDTITVDSNTVERNWGEGIGCWQAVGCTVRGNRVGDNYSVQLYVDNSSRVRLEGNFAYVSGDTAFLSHAPWAPPGGVLPAGVQLANELPLAAPRRLDRVTMVNNIVLGGSSALFVGAYGAGGGLRNATIANNTFVGGTAETLHIENDPGHAAVRVFNNIFARGRGGAAGTLTTRFDPRAFAFSANLWDGGRPTVRAGAGDVYAAAGLVAPGRLAPSGYRLRADSPAMDAGVAGGAPAADFWGVARPRGARWDLGAHER